MVEAGATEGHRRRGRRGHRVRPRAAARRSSPRSANWWPRPASRSARSRRRSIDEDVLQGRSRRRSASGLTTRSTPRSTASRKLRQVDALKDEPWRPIPTKMRRPEQKLASCFDAAARTYLPRRDAERAPAVPTAARSTRSARSRAKSACCPAPTARRCSPAARPRRW